MSDRLIQQCILQILEPVCEAKFHNHSFGFRPNRSTEHAKATMDRMINLQHLHFVVDIDIKGFYDNVNHGEFLKQMWTVGIQDKNILCIILTISANLGLLGDMNALTAAGDGTPIATSVYTRSKSTCNCRALGLAVCNHPRICSQPDCNTGWDSAREKYFNGYHLYMISASDSYYDLPLYPRLQPASRHDAVSLVISSVEFKQRFTLDTVDKMLLDATLMLMPFIAYWITKTPNRLSISTAEVRKIPRLAKIYSFHRGVFPYAPSA